jgi:hypothetical protein
VLSTNAGAATHPRSCVHDARGAAGAKREKDPEKSV